MGNQKEVVIKVINYIERNLEKEISLEKIAKNIGYSKFHLNRIFTEYTGITMYQYIQNRRLTVAAEKLVKTKEPIVQIAYEAGYGTQQSFSFAFKQVYQYPPKIYRNIGIFEPKQNRISMCKIYTPFLSQTVSGILPSIESLEIYFRTYISHCKFAAEDKEAAA